MPTNRITSHLSKTSPIAKPVLPQGFVACMLPPGMSTTSQPAAFHTELMRRAYEQARRDLVPLHYRRLFQRN